MRAGGGDRPLIDQTEPTLVEVARRVDDARVGEDR
jgi:hypothetical protein